MRGDHKIQGAVFSCISPEKRIPRDHPLRPTRKMVKQALAAQLLETVLDKAKGANLLSDEHFTVDGTMVEAWASMKSIRPRDGGGPDPGGGKNLDVSFRGEKRTSETHSFVTDPEARMARKGPDKETRLCFTGHVLVENRNGLAEEPP